jgi:hypothetical protein
VSDRVKRHLSPSLVISCAALFIALGSAGYAATGGNFILGQANDANATSSLSSTVSSGPTLSLTNTGNKPAARFVTDVGVPPFTVNRGQKVVNLNADRLDSLDSSSLLQTSTLAGGDLSGTFDNLQIATGAVGSNEVANESLTASDLATDSVNATEIANDSIDSGEIVDFGLSNQDVGVEFAQINADGTVANSSGGVTAIHIGAGTYEVDFGHTISSCGFVATQGEAGVGGAGGAITGVTDRSGNAEAVFATTRTDANVLADKAFQLVVVC